MKKFKIGISTTCDICNKEICSSGLYLHKRYKHFKMEHTESQLTAVSISNKTRIVKRTEEQKERARLAQLKIKDKMSKITKEKWKDTLFIKNQQIGRSIMPNKKELILLNLLNKLFNNKWKYTGDFSFCINGKCPDYTHNTEKKLIELYGDYWHQGQNPQYRIDFFKKEGYETLVIWEHELKDMNKVKERLFSFVEEKNRAIP